MRIMALVLASALAVCFMNPASAATKRSDTASSAANPEISLSQFSRLHRILLPQRQTENSESEA